MFGFGKKTRKRRRSTSRKRTATKSRRRTPPRGKNGRFKKR